MARSAVQDVLEKFRFKVTFLNADVFQVPVLSGTILPASSPNLNQDNSISAGFSEVTIPRVTINERTYRENIDSIRKIKAPGLATYEPLTLKRGVTNNRELYNWYKKVNNDANALNQFNNILAAQNVIPILDPEYRKDMIIQLLDREGTTKRAWFIFNAFPNSYKGGDDLSSSDENKLIEELGISYEAFVELPTADIQALTEESTAAASDAFVAAAVGLLTGN